MTAIYADRVKETTTTTGTGTYSLAGAVTGFQTFVAGAGTTSVCHYVATNDTDWEIGIGTVTDASPDTLSRDTILASSNSGSAVDWIAGTKTVALMIPAAEMNGLATGNIYRLPIGYGSATTLTVGSGNCRNSVDTRNVQVTSTQTVDITATGSLGLGTLTSGTTFTTNGTATLTAAASVWTNDLTAYRRTLTGTFSTSTTTLTGSSSKLLSEASVGDVIRVGAKGAARITAIASDTSATLIAALPDGDAGAGQTAYVNENLTIKVGSETARRVDTIDNAGTTVVQSSAASGSAGGQVGTWGVETISCWFAVWAATVSGNGRAFLSTQRTTPFSFSGLTDYRLIGWVYNDSGGDFLPGTWTGSSGSREFYNESTSSLLLSAGNATSWTRIDSSSWAPPGARVVLASAAVAAGKNAWFRAASLGSSTTTRNLKIYGATGAGVVTTATIPTDAAQCFDYVTDSSSTVDVQILGYRLDL